MQIRSTIAEWQIQEFLEVLKKNKIKKNSIKYVKHLFMFGEAKANAQASEGQASFNYDEFVKAYKNYWKLS
ncbi:MAG: Unknown protein [uncultured Sulfurovum sp.]|uniref:Uncharacterized protein n=1 Tax=uncultured Sulfurovum sp. TaxID=269237 RepID=A0A6S6SEP6_9BACT|nr:MAG: Unknown protein [uncultured Sulfurovum sp.]